MLIIPCKYVIRLATIIAASAFILASCGEGRKADTTAVAVPEAAEEAKSLTVIFTGDLMQHEPQVRAALQEDGTYDYDDCFRYIAPLFRETDLVVANLETTLSETGPYYGYPNFRSPAALAGAMKLAGIDVALMANNHICDRGSSGIQRTARALDEAELMRTGAFPDSTDHATGHPLTIEKNGFRLTILNYTYGTNGMPVPHGMAVNLIDTASIARDLAGLERSEDHLVAVCIHWGEEYHTRQNAVQDSLATWLHKRGVDMIIGGHPHVVQPMHATADTTGRPRITVFSLGNFLSNQQYPNTDGGMAVRLTVEKEGDNPVTVKAENFYVWTRRARDGEGRLRYHIIPSYLTGTLLAADPAAAAKYTSFITAARKITGTDNGFKEITSHDISGNTGTEIKSFHDIREESHSFDMP